MMASPTREPQPKAAAKAASPARGSARPVRPWLPRGQAGGAGRLVPLPSFPHRGEIGERLGRPFSARAVLDPENCERRGVPAYTKDGQAHFSSPTPAIRVAAHEAAHVLQQKGVTRDMGLGAEGHAAAIEQRIARGADAGPLLGNQGAAATGAALHYTLIPEKTQAPKKWDANMDVRVAEDGSMAVGQGGLLQEFWALPWKVRDSNAKLKAVGSVIELILQSETLAGTAPNSGVLRTLTKVVPKNLANKTSAENMYLWADCGRAGRDVMGAGEGTGAKSQKMAAMFKIPLKPVDPPGPAKVMTRDTEASHPELMKKEILHKKLGRKNGDEALTYYQGLPQAQRDKIDKELGINKYAAPQTGEGYTMSSGGAKYAGERTWNFHWAGVVMVSGLDRVALENYAVGNPLKTNTDWEFQMYGSAAKAGQTFHEQHEATHKHGKAPTTMAVHKRK